MGLAHCFVRARLSRRAQSVTPIESTLTPNLLLAESIFSPSHLAADPVGQPAYKSTAAAAAASAAPYLHFNVLRKLPMSLGGRHARVVAIDGD